MVAMRMDGRISARFDPSDVVQEALVIASNRLATYVKQQSIPFYPWLRGIAWEQLLKHHERHVRAQKRSINREHPCPPPLNDESVELLANRLTGGERSPSEQFMRMERRTRVRQALESLKPRDREVIELRYLEHLDNTEIAAVLNISVAAVRTRHFRAIQRLHETLADESQT
jgi:RNA polymerase sigma-70 factor (ECF subfamily)